MTLLFGLRLQLESQAITLRSTTFHDLAAAVGKGGNNGGNGDNGNKRQTGAGTSRVKTACSVF